MRIVEKRTPDPYRDPVKLGDVIFIKGFTYYLVCNTAKGETVLSSLSDGNRHTDPCKGMKYEDRRDAIEQMAKYAPWFKVDAEVHIN